MTRQPGVDARIHRPDPPDPLQDAPGPTISKPAIPQHPPNSDLDRARELLRKAFPPPAPRPTISADEAQYRRLTQPGWVNLDELARRKAEDWERRNPPGFLGGCGEEFCD
jgi:hypothetical protein